MRPGRMPPALAVLLVLCGCTQGGHDAAPRQIAFLNHCYAVVDAETARAIEDSEALGSFASFEVHTTRLANGDHWTGRYLHGAHTYLEIFGPDDGGGPAGATGVGVSADRQGGLQELATRLSDAGVGRFDLDRVTRRLDAQEVPWYDRPASPRGARIAGGLGHGICGAVHG